MADLHIERITLDYQGALLDPEGKLLRNLSAVAVAGDYLWTASDEGRTVECLKRDGKGYRFSDQIKLDDRFEYLPKKHDPGEGLPEADIESLAIHDGYLWICGSHCHVRRHVRGKAKAQPGDAPDVRRLSPKLRDRPSRHLLGRVKIEGDGGKLAETGENLPFGRRGLSAYLADDAFLGPFLSLPSKENGLDIEGLAISESGTVLLGLRGPLVDSFAVILELSLPKGLTLRGATMITHFLDLGGLGVRDLTAHGRDILILAGPVSGVRSPFRIYRWHPADRKRQVQTPDLLYPQPDEVHVSKPIIADMARADSDEHPEGICVLARGTKGLIVLFDNPREDPPNSRIDGSKYFADWIPVT